MIDDDFKKALFTCHIGINGVLRIDLSKMDDAEKSVLKHDISRWIDKLCAFEEKIEYEDKTWSRIQP